MRSFAEDVFVATALGEAAGSVGIPPRDRMSLALRHRLFGHSRTGI
jgi:hypothetical protein